MILTLDIGNTNIKAALFEGDAIKGSWRISTNHMYTADEYGLMLEGLMRHNGFALSDVTGIMISSVVPTINYTIEHMCDRYYNLYLELNGEKNGN